MNKVLLVILLILIVIYICTLPKTYGQSIISPEHFTLTDTINQESTTTVNTTNQESTNTIDTSNKDDTQNSILPVIENDNIDSDYSNMDTDLNRSTENQTLDTTVSNYQNVYVSQSSTTDMTSPFGTINSNVVSNMMSDIRAEDTDEHKTDPEMMNVNNGNNSMDDSNTGSCSLADCGTNGLFPVLEPGFNMRETAKQCILLEDHLNNLKKRCRDCIRKHFLTIDGFLEESVSLEKDISKRQYYRNLHTEWNRIQREYARNPTNSDNLDIISQKIRAFRKPLVAKYYDDVSEYEI